MKKIKRSYIWLTLLFLAGTVQTIVAKPGEQVEIKSVQFKGNSAFSGDQLRGIMISKPSSLFKKRYYHAEVLHNDLDNIALSYKQQGYLESKIADYQVEKDTAKKAVYITIDIDEGIRTFVESVSLSGNEFFSGKALGKVITLREGEPLLQKKIDESTTRVLNYYSNNGFLDAQVQTDIKVLADSQMAFVNFVIREGPQYRIDDIQLNGLTITKPHVVTRELTFKKGEVVDYSKLLNSQRLLYLTGLFQSVYISLRPASEQDSTLKIVLVDLKDKIPAQFNISGGYGSVEKFRIKTEVYNDNISGSARKAGIALKYSSLYLGAEASFTEPWTFQHGPEP